MALSKEALNKEIKSSSGGIHWSRRLLKIATVILPVGFLVAFAYLSHLALLEAVHKAVASAALIAISAPIIYFFSRWVFARIEAAESRALSRHRELLLLNTVAGAASRPMPLEKVLQVAIDGAVEATGVSGGLVCILDEANKELLHVACRNIPDSLLGPMRKVKLESDAVGSQVVRTGEPLQIRDITSDPRIGAKGRESGFKSLISLPLKSDGKVNGVMALVSREQLSFDDSQVDFLLTMGGQLAAAIERAKLRQQIADIAVIEERERIAREMHDGLGQVLGYINTQTLALKRLLSDNRIEEATEEATKMEEVARDLYADVREGILGLRVAPHRDGGFLPALGAYIIRFEEMCGVSTTLNSSEDAENAHLPPSAEVQLMRIVQEALTNVRKHSKAKSVTINVDCIAGRLVICVSDDGDGFDPTRLQVAGWPRFGLHTMGERAESVGGTFNIDSEAGCGTRISVSIPMDEHSWVGVIA